MGSVAGKNANKPLSALNGKENCESCDFFGFNFG